MKFIFAETVEEVLAAALEKPKTKKKAAPKNKKTTKKKVTKNAKTSIAEQSAKIEANLKNDPDFVKSYEQSEKNAKAKGETFVAMKDREVVALIAYLQRLGTDIKVKETQK